MLTYWQLLTLTFLQPIQTVNRLSWSEVQKLSLWLKGPSTTSTDVDAVLVINNELFHQDKRNKRNMKEEKRKKTAQENMDYLEPKLLLTIKTYSRIKYKEFVAPYLY